jgi:hypothetical protein
MMTEIDIWRAAYLVLWWYGDTAREKNARPADEFAADGDPPAKRASAGSSMRSGSSRI